MGGSLLRRVYPEIASETLRNPVTRQRVIAQVSRVDYTPAGERVLSAADKIQGITDQEFRFEAVVKLDRRKIGHGDIRLALQQLRLFWVNQCSAPASVKSACPALSWG